LQSGTVQRQWRIRIFDRNALDLLGLRHSCCAQEGRRDGCKYAASFGHGALFSSYFSA
jgi:hypothetical protein